KCADYLEYSKKPHPPLSEGDLQLPYMRPPEQCRTFKSEIVEKIINDLTGKIENPDLARLVENCLPNTLDTTILWFEEESGQKQGYPNTNSVDYTKLAKTFVVTGDIHAEWLRDAARQLSVYQPMIKYDKNLQNLMKGAINLQAWYITKAPYCNAFQPPMESNIKRKPSAIDYVTPRPSWKHVFECKWELDSLASFLTLSNEYYENSGDLSFINDIWLDAFEMILTVLRRQSSPTYDKNGGVLPYYYTFQRDTKIGSETLPLAGTGNPVNLDTGLIRSSFRPSDDACILQFFIPANAHMCVELKRAIKYLKKTNQNNLSTIAENFIEAIYKGIYEHGIIDHPTFGKIFAYEVDGYGGKISMDDANLPSLLSLPDLGFVSATDEIYQNTRKAILSKSGNPYYLTGKYFKGIGGPHIGITYAWPMSLLIAIRTSDDDKEILDTLNLLIESTGGLGLMHESVNVNFPQGLSYTRPWFAWCNSEFGKTILDLAKRKPHLIFKDEFKNLSYDVENL
ncbi:hypothetical protein PACTADRAFT_21323, partial [Pachysolen tannophilus NRRL Y-2460]